MDYLGNYRALWLLFIIPTVLVPLYVWCFWRKAAMLKILANTAVLKKINTSVSLHKQILKAVLLIAAFVSIVIALTQPRWNPKPMQIKRQGRDIVILLDTSRSMLAEDIKPSRLERAKLAIKDLLEKLQGDRIAIVTFAGNSTIKCPLTQDYAFVQTVLADISTESTSRGGTNIGDAIRKATEEIFDRKSRQYKDIILISDGNDQDSFPVQAAEKASTEGVRIIVIGMGNTKEGARIPITGSNGEKTFLQYDNKEVWSVSEANKLREIAYATKDGKYIQVEPGMTLNLDELYDELVATAEKRKLESATMMTYDERFQIFIALAILLLICEVSVSERKN